MKMKISTLGTLDIMNLEVILNNKLELFEEMVTLTNEMTQAKTEADFNFIEDELHRNEEKMHDNEDAILNFVEDKKHKYCEDTGNI
jgi:hypothetical protein